MSQIISLLDSISNFFAKLPPGAWTLLAATVAFLGVRATINDQGKRLSLQFGHDRALKDREREMQMRKEIFLGAAEAFSAGLKSLYRYPEPAILSTELIADYLTKSVAFARLYVVAKPATTVAVAAVVDAISVAQWKLAKSRHQMMVSNNHVEIYDSLRERAEKERDHIFEIARHDHVEGLKDMDRRARLDKSFDHHREAIDKLIADRVRYRYDVEIRRIAMIREARGLELELVGAMIDTIIALRTELELPVDREELRTAFDKSVAVLNEPVEDFLRHVEDSLNK